MRLLLIQRLSEMYVVRALKSDVDFFISDNHQMMGLIKM